MNDKQLKALTDKVGDRNVYWNGSGNLRVSGVKTTEFSRDERKVLNAQVAYENRGTINAFQAEMKRQLGW